MTTGQSPNSETRTFRASLSDTAEIDRWMEEIGAQRGIAERVIFRARVCVAELVANAIEHAGASAERDTVTITLQLQGPDLGIEYADTSAPFDPSTIPPAPIASLENASLGGRGLRLLHAYASHLTYRHDGARNVVSFRTNSQQPILEGRASAAFHP
jgi:serine/threonine-protein kinase RsbW